MSTERNIKRLERVAKQKIVSSDLGQKTIAVLNSKPVYNSRVACKVINQKKGASWYLLAVTLAVGIQNGYTWAKTDILAFDSAFALGVTVVAFIAYIAQGD